jgi:hypothetical protein
MTLDDSIFYFTSVAIIRHLKRTKGIKKRKREGKKERFGMSLNFNGPLRLVMFEYRWVSD